MVVLTIVAVVTFFMVIGMLIEIDMVVHVVRAVGAMEDPHRRGPDFIDRKDRHAEDHEKTKVPHQGMTAMVLTAIFPGGGMAVAMSRMDHQVRNRGGLVEAVKRMFLSPLGAGWWFALLGKATKISTVSGQDPWTDHFKESHAGDWI